MSKYIHGLKRMSENPAFVQSDPSFAKLIGIAEVWEDDRAKYKEALESIKLITLNNHDHDTIRINKITNEALNE